MAYVLQKRKEEKLLYEKKNLERKILIAMPLFEKAKRTLGLWLDCLANYFSVWPILNFWQKWNILNIQQQPFFLELFSFDWVNVLGLISPALTPTLYIQAELPYREE